MVRYQDQLNDITRILSGLEKQADAGGNITDKDVLEGDIRGKEGPGKPGDKSKETNEGVSGPQDPLQEDAGNSADYVLDPDKRKEEATDKMADANRSGDLLMKNLYAELYGKEAMEEEEEDMSDEEEDMSDEDYSDMELSEEEKKELSKASAEKKKNYLMCKKAGQDFAKELHETGMLEKIAVAAYAPQLEKISSMEAGRTLALLEKQGMLPSDQDLVDYASFIAGAQIADLEKQGKLKILDPELKKMVKEAREQSQEQTAQAEPNLEKTAAENNLMIKRAAEESATTVLNDLYNLDAGKNINAKLDKLVNPQ